MYGKVFRQMYKGSMSRQGWEAIVTMQQFIVMADRHGTVDMTLEAIAAETTIPLEVLQKGVEILSRPDPGSRTPDEDGRRIVLLDNRRDWGWQLVNYATYRKMQSDEDRREYQRQYWHTRQDKKKTQHDSTNSIHADADADADADAESKSGKEGEGAIAPARSSKKKSTGSRIPEGWQPSEAERAYATEHLPRVNVDALAECFRDHWTAKAGASAVKLDWAATWRTWVRRCNEYGYPMTTSGNGTEKPVVRFDSSGRQISG